MKLLLTTLLGLCLCAATQGRPNVVLIMADDVEWEAFGYLNPNDKTFGHLMQQAGYKTAIAGKRQLNGLDNNLPGHGDNTRPQPKRATRIPSTDRSIPVGKNPTRRPQT